MQLWDVCDDQKAVDLIKGIKDPQEASRTLLDYALQSVSASPPSPVRLIVSSRRKFSSDNLSVLVIALQPEN